MRVEKAVKIQKIWVKVQSFVLLYVFQSSPQGRIRLFVRTNWPLGFEALLGCR